MADEGNERLVLVARKGGDTGLPTACPACLPAYFYLKLAGAAFDLRYDVANPDSDHVPYVERGNYVAFNNEKGGVIESLKEEDIVNLDSNLSNNSFPDWLSTKAMISSWLMEAAQYELWVASDGSIADKIYFSDLPWPIGKVLHWKQTRAAKQLLGITDLNSEDKQEEIYRRADKAYEAVSMRLGEQAFFFEDRPTSVDAIFLGHAFFVLYALPDTSVLRSDLLKHDNLVRYAEGHKMELLNTDSSSSIPRSPSDAPTSSTTRRKSSTSSNANPKPKPKREKTEEEKTFRRRAKYFLATQLVSVLVFLSLLGGTDVPEYEDGDEDGISYED